MRLRSLLRLSQVLTLTAFLIVPRAALPDSSVVFSMVFAGFPGGSVLDWLRSKGFQPQRDATNANRVVFYFQGRDLALETRRRAFGLLLNEIDVTGYSKIRIQWGVDKFPEGASYERGVRAEAIMIYVFFGTEKVSSGSMFIPNSPYFLGLFLCEDDEIGKPFVGRYFRAGGRFICVAHPRVGELITTEFPIAEVFKRTFGQNEAPDISGLGLAIDTNNARGSGVARGFVYRIEFVK